MRATLRLLSFMALCLGAAVTSASSHVDYVVEGKTFHSPEPALAYHEDLLDQWVQNVEPRSAPLAERAYVVIPSFDYLSEGVTRTTSGSEERIRTTTTIVDRNWLLLERLIRQRGIFDEVILVRSEDPGAVVSQNGDYVLWFHTDGHASFYQIKSHDAADFTDLDIAGAGSSSRPAMHQSLIHAIEEYASR